MFDDATGEAYLCLGDVGGASLPRMRVVVRPGLVRGSDNRNDHCPGT